MHLDVLDIRDFYYRTGLGRAVQRAIRARVLGFWPDASGLTMAGFGFAVPLLRPYLGGARRVIGLMPARQGVMAWPPGMANVSVLCEEERWPLPNGIVDRLVMLHGLETSDHHVAVLREAYRVLADDGAALFIVPNRSGLWARRDVTPFGTGRSYTLGQIEAQLDRHDFIAGRHAAALFAPPARRGFWLRTADMWERLGCRLSPHFAGGVLLVEAHKRIPPTLRPGVRVAPHPARILDGVPAPVAPRPA